MHDDRKFARTAASLSDETVIDGIRVIRDALVEVVPDGDGGIKMSAPLVEGKTVNEVAEALYTTFDGKVPEESRTLARDLVYIGTEAGEDKAEFLAVHWNLDIAVQEWEQVQKNIEFAEDPDSE